jgi:membrane-bound lytic murein transglycosylase A
MSTAEPAPSGAGPESPTPVGLAVPGAELRPADFAALPGWGSDDLLAALRVFRAGAAHLVAQKPPLRPAEAASPALLAACEAALASEARDNASARAFFEANFAPAEILPASEMPFFTGYFEPQCDGATAKSADFTAPILARPADLVTLPQGETLPDSDPPLTSARRVGEALLPFPDRAAILDGALVGQGIELLWLKDEVEVFIIQVQGSARVRLDDGRTIRLRYAGRNGWPYTSIGRLLVEQGAIALADMSLETLTSWLRAHPDEAREVMRRNRSYVFFAIDDLLNAEEGPIGGAGLPLTPGRSIAIDRNLWAYGLPFFAGMLAGRQRHRGRLFVLAPRGAAATP